MNESPPAVHSYEETPENRPASGLALAAAAAMSQFSALTGTAPQAVSGIRARPEGGWSVLIDVVELARVPDSTTVMATYRVDLDGERELCACERLRRYLRGTTDP